MENTKKMPVENIGKKRIDTKRLVQLGMLAALMIVMEFTGIGIIPIGFGFEITILMIPVVIGAMAVGKGGGAILGGVFGLLSLWECFGKSAFGTFLFGLNPFATILICLVPRILAGFLSGVIFELLKTHDKTKLLCYGGAALTGSLVNTILFVGGVIAVFWNNTEFITTMIEWGMPTESFMVFAWGIVGVNGIIEAIFNTIIGAGIAKVINKTINKV